MSVHVHQLRGCSPAPLALYLKAIGILRLVAEQKDPNARGWWQHEHFCLLTEVDRDQLEQFFLEEYSPTPFLSPWNKGSGFYTDNDPGLSPIERSVASRFGQFRDAIQDARQLLTAIGEADAAIRAIKDRTKTNRAFQDARQREILRNSVAFTGAVKTLELQLADAGKSSDSNDAAMTALEEVQSIVSEANRPPTKAEAARLKTNAGYRLLLRAAEREFKRLKACLLPDCCRRWRGPHAKWMSASVVLAENGEPQFPSLLGTGGNDGNLDFTKNAMLQLGTLFDLASENGAPRNGAADLVRDALWGNATNHVNPQPIGQFFPGSGGGANSSNGPGGDPSINGWDFVLMLEGAVAFRARATRRFDHSSKTKASAPFAVNGHPAGHASPGRENDVRGEQWLPLWPQPTTMDDVIGLLGDARLQLGRQVVNRPIDAARAISRLGVARGIAEFTRYGFLERNGQSTLAVPLGRLRVQHRPRASLIDDLAGWMNTLQGLARDSHAPARLVHAERRLADAVFAVLTHDDSPSRWQAVLEAAADVEYLQAGGTALKAEPIPKLQPAWIKAIHDGTPEVRLALAIASAAADYTETAGPVDPVRHHWLPLRPGASRFQTADRRLVVDPRVVIFGRDPTADLAAVVARRLLEAQSGSRRVLPLESAPGCDAQLADLAALIDGHVDLSRVLTLGRALMALDWRNWNAGLLPAATRTGEHPEEAWLALRLACLPWPIDERLSIPAEPSLLNRLLSGDAFGAVRVAAQRLSASGIRIPFRSAFTDAGTARLWAAALAFPISRYTARRAVEILVPNFFGVSHVGSFSTR